MAQVRQDRKYIHLCPPTTEQIVSRVSIWVAERLQSAIIINIHQVPQS